MKKLQSIISFITAVVLFTSCSREITVVKRHYRNGYYVEIGDKQLKAKDESSVAREEVQVPVSASSQRSGPDQIIPHRPFNLDRGPEASRESSLDAVKKNVKQNSVKSRLLSPDEKAAAKMLLKHPVKIKKKLTEVKNLKPRSDLGNIIWVIIVVLVILWLLGLLIGGLGLGGIIHTLLVIALILLILRLLGII